MKSADQAKINNIWNTLRFFRLSVFRLEITFYRGEVLDQALYKSCPDFENCVRLSTSGSCCIATRLSQIWKSNLNFQPDIYQQFLMMEKRNLSNTYFLDYSLLFLLEKRTMNILNTTFTIWHITYLRGWWSRLKYSP